MLAVLVAAVVLLTLPGISVRAGRRLPPKEWTWLCVTAVGGGLVLLEAGLVLRGAPPVLRAAGVAWLAKACERMLGPLLAGGPAASWVAGAGAVAIPMASVLVLRTGRRVRRRLTAELWLGELRLIAGYAVVVLPIRRPLAFSFDLGNHQQVIVASDGLFGALGPSHSEVVLRHEAAHLRHRHQRLLALSTVAERVLGWFPGVTRSAAALNLGVERWADEDAAGSSPAGRLAVRNSLLALAGLSPVEGVAPFADAKTVAARLVALESPPLRPSFSQRAPLYLPGGAAGLAATPALLAWGSHMHMVLAMSGRCSI